MKWEMINGFIYANRPKASKEMFDEFIKRFGFNQYILSPWPKHFDRFMNGDKSYNAGKWKFEELPPYRDHAVAFREKSTNRIMYVFHPYVYSEDQVMELEKYCNKRGLIYLVCPETKSFYYPGSTKMILIMSENTYLDFLSVPGFPEEWEE